MLNGLGDVLKHVNQHCADVVVVHAAKYLFARTLTAHHPRRTQQAQMMADERGAQMEFFGNVRDRDGFVQAGQYDVQTGLVTE